MFLPRALAALVTMIALAGPALCGGSLPLDEVMEVARRNPALTNEINGALKQEGIDAKDVVCSGSRFGNQWKYLGGARTLPFECGIGKRTLTIDGTVQYLDAKGKIIKGGIDNPKVFSSAREKKETGLKWTWN